MFVSKRFLYIGEMRSYIYKLETRLAILPNVDFVYFLEFFNLSDIAGFYLICCVFLVLFTC